MKELNSYWFSARENFGDLLTPLLLQHYGFTVQNCPIDTSDVLVVGSILQDLRKPFSGYVIGAGLIDDRVQDLSQAKVLALRGELTRARVNVDANTVLADPGILLPAFLEKRREKKYLMGVVPHYVDKPDPRLQQLKYRYPDDLVVIDVERHPLEVASDIDQCHFILSSSLHGLIVADSLGIPNQWLLLSQKVLGAGFKFRDYFSSVGVRQQPMVLTGAERLSDLLPVSVASADLMAEKRDQLDHCFKAFRQEWSAY